MRYLTALVRPDSGDRFHPLGEDLAAESGIEREAIHHVELLADGAVLLFAEGSGDPDRYEAVMRESPYVRDFMVAGDERWMAVSQFESTDATRRMLEVQRSTDVVIETPIHVNDDGSIRVTYVGSEADLRRLFRDAPADAGVTIEVVGTGEYDPDEGRLTRLLTDRQREVLEAAVTVGYYGAPRQATLDDVADAVGIAPATAGEHLRKVEERVFDALVG
ncbi:helix-turn-helix domain-containing protein [Halobacterium wangiae]|uniref:helix-turn-helix domain-containing protein n=1 Tax=Halobacterium wangiae TaxID=2902623 RepID=UPI001E29F667|nr:helix-turn-helix domain-containing protein [Halobacterium wangiae]